MRTAPISPDARRNLSSALETRPNFSSSFVRRVRSSGSTQASRSPTGLPIASARRQRTPSKKASFASTKTSSESRTTAMAIGLARNIAAMLRSLWNRPRSPKGAASRRVRVATTRTLPSESTSGNALIVAQSTSPLRRPGAPTSTSSMGTFWARALWTGCSSRGRAAPSLRSSPHSGSAAGLPTHSPSSTPSNPRARRLAAKIRPSGPQTSTPSRRRSNSTYWKLSRWSASVMRTSECVEAETPDNYRRLRRLLRVRCP